MIGVNHDITVILPVCDLPPCFHSPSTADLEVRRPLAVGVDIQWGALLSDPLLAARLQMFSYYGGAWWCRWPKNKNPGHLERNKQLNRESFALVDHLFSSFTFPFAKRQLQIWIQAPPLPCLLSLTGIYISLQIEISFRKRRMERAQLKTQCNCHKQQ